MPKEQYSNVNRHLSEAIKGLQESTHPDDPSLAQIVQGVLDLRVKRADTALGRVATETLHNLDANEPMGSELNRILASFNISPKTMTYLMLSSTPTSIPELKMLFRETFQGSALDSLTDRRTNSAKQYAETLVKFGLAEKTAEGYTVGNNEEKNKIIAAKFIDFEREKGYSLHPILGQTAIPGADQQRVPLTRARILLALSSGTLVTELSEKLGLPEDVVGTHLNQLKNAGVVAFDFQVKPSRRTVFYKLVEGADFENVTILRRPNRTLNKYIVEICLQLGAQNEPITAQAVFNNLPPEYANGLDTKYLHQDINRILKTYADNHRLEGAEEKELEKIAKTFQFTEKGREVAFDLLIPLVDALENGQTLQDWKTDALPNVLNNFQKYAHEVAELYYPVSWGERRRNTPILIGDILEYVRLYAQEFNFDIQAQEIEFLTGAPRQTINNLLLRLVREGKLTRKWKSGVYAYSLPSNA